MKKIKLLAVLVIMPFLVSCTKVISNPDIQTLSNKASELMNSGDIKGAISRLESINDLNPNFPQNNYNLGVAYYKDQEYDKAINSLKRAIDLDKNLTDAYYTIALAYESIAQNLKDSLDNKSQKNTESKQTDSVEVSEEKVLSKTEIEAKIIDSLKNSKDYYSQYIALINNNDDIERINTEIENIDSEIKSISTENK